MYNVSRGCVTIIPDRRQGLRKQLTDRIIPSLLFDQLRKNREIIERVRGRLPPISFSLLLRLPFSLFLSLRTLPYFEIRGHIRLKLSHPSVKVSPTGTIHRSTPITGFWPGYYRLRNAHIMNEVNFAIHRVPDSDFVKLFRHARIMQFSRNGNVKSCAQL